MQDGNTTEGTPEPAPREGDAASPAGTLFALPVPMLQAINAATPERAYHLDTVFNCIGADAEARLAILQALADLYKAPETTKEHLLRITETGLPARRILLAALGIKQGAAQERAIYKESGAHIVAMLLAMIPKLYITPHGMQQPGSRVQIARDNAPDQIGTVQAIAFGGLYRVAIDGKSVQATEEAWPCECVPLMPEPNAAGGYFVPIYRTPSGHDIAFIYPDMIAVDAPGALLCAARAIALEKFHASLKC